MSPLAEDIYQILRTQVPSPEGRITYGEMIARLPIEHGIENANDYRLNPVYSEIGDSCHRHGLPAITAILVRKGDDGQPDEPGPGHYSAVYPHVGNDRDRQRIEWARELELVRQTTYPNRLD